MIEPVRCPFCGLDPYEYVDVGVGYVPVAVNCCHLGPMLFDWRTEQDVHDLAQTIADELADMPAGPEKVEKGEDMIEERIT